MGRFRARWRPSGGADAPSEVIALLGVQPSGFEAQLAEFAGSNATVAAGLGGIEDDEASSMRVKRPFL